MPNRTVPLLFAVLGLFAGARAVDHIVPAVEDGGARAALIALYFTLSAAVTITFAVLTARRPASVTPSRKPAAFIACAAAMVVGLPIEGPASSASTSLVLTGDVIATLSCAWLLISVLALGTCFGVLPEARGLVIRGPYRFIRHPVYLGEIGALTGLAISSSRPWAVPVVLAFIIAQSARMRMEEAALTSAFPEYRLYAAQTGRLLPRLGGRAREQPDLRLAPPSTSSVAVAAGRR